MPRMRIAAQLYTVRELTRQDFAGTIQAVAAIGYRAVELAGYGNLRGASEVRKVLSDHGMVVVGSHTNLDGLERNLGRLLDDSEALGNKTIVLSFLPEPRRRDADGWRATAGVLDEIGWGCRTQGLELAYHHHHFEFLKFDGQAGFDLLWQHSSPQNLKAELDTFWLRYAGEDPAGYIRRLGPRATHLHLKDITPDRRFGEVGAGTLDFPAILAAAEEAAVRWGVVEQDSTYDRPPLEALRISFDNLRRMGAA